MEPKTILGISFNTRLLGLAVIRSGLLVHYAVVLRKEKWDSHKKDKILTSLASCIDDYNITNIALSIPHRFHQVPEFQELYDAILVFVAGKNIKAMVYAPDALLLLHYSKRKKATKREMMQFLTTIFPELEVPFKKEAENKSKYYIKLFEAVAAATLYSHSLYRHK